MKTKTEKASNKKATAPATLAEVAEKHNIEALKKINSWKKLYNEAGNLILPAPEITEEELEDFDSLEEAAAVVMNPRKRAASVIFDLLNALAASHEGTAEYTRQLQSWAGGELAGYTKGNPARVAAQLCEWGLDSAAPGFALDTPRNWKKRGYELKDTARPIFVVTPLFTPEDEKKAEQEGKAIVDFSETADNAGEPEKKRKKRYAIHALFAPADVNKVREIKRRKVKKSEATTRAEAMRQEAEKPAPKKRKPAQKKVSAMGAGYASMLSNMAPSAAPVLMNEPELAQLALSI